MARVLLLTLYGFCAMETGTNITPVTQTGLAPAPTAGHPTADSDDQDHSLFGADGLTFHDLLDIINPLQHLPVVSNIYREMSGDELSPGARMMGGGLFGGFIGLGVAMFNAVLEDLTGKDVGSHVIAFFRGGDDGGNGDGVPAEVMVAADEAPRTPPPPAATVSSSPTSAPVPLPPVPVAAVHREELPPLPTAPQQLASKPPPPPGPAPAQARALAGRVRPAGYLMNTELLNLLMFSVPVGIGEYWRETDQPEGRPKNGNTGHDQTSVDQVPDAPALAAAQQAYQSGLDTRSTAISGATFTPIGPAEQL